MWKCLLASGVTGAVCIQSAAYGGDHAYLLNALKVSFGLVGVCLLDPNDPNQLASASRLFESARFGGARLHWLFDRDPEDWLRPGQTPTWDFLAGRSAIVSVLLDPDRLSLLGRLARQQPDLTFLVDHLGRLTPASSAASVRELIRLAALPNVSVKVSGLASLSVEGFPYRDMRSLIQTCFDSYGADRLVWGTDFPYCLTVGPYELARRGVLEALPAAVDADLELIFGGNAARMYRFDSFQAV